MSESKKEFNTSGVSHIHKKKHTIQFSPYHEKSRAKFDRIWKKSIPSCSVTSLKILTMKYYGILFSC